MFEEALETLSGQRGLWVRGREHDVSYEVPEKARDEEERTRR
jgi:hypothetical protein